MSFLAALLLFVCLSLSMHACNARHLRTKTSTIVDRQLELGVAEKKNPDSSSILSRPSSLFISKDFQAQLQDDEQVRNKGIAGIVRSMLEVITPFRKNDLHRQATEVEKIQERSIRFTSESSQAKQDDAKETVDSKDSGDSVVEDVVVMDYAQPHRKPPIHNEKN